MTVIDELNEYEKKLEKYDNSLEGILYNIKSNECDEEEEENKLIIAKTLQKLPKDVRDRVMSKVIFLHILRYGTIIKLYFPVPQKTKRIEQYFILLNFSLMKNEGKTKMDMMNTVAHEVAHYILRHYSGSIDADPKDERHADDLAEKWGFKRTYKESDYDWFEKKSK